MKFQLRTARWISILVALTSGALMFYVYRNLWTRPFAADDYEWILNVRGLSWSELLQRAFNPAAQTHFYRPLVWLLFWWQVRAFDLDPHGFHGVSLVLHTINAALLGTLAYRLQNTMRRSHLTASYTMPVFVIVSIALHPAPFEAIVWISAQSELLAAMLLLCALHAWLPRANVKQNIFQLFVATSALGLALLTKESAAIGLPLLMLIGSAQQRIEQREAHSRNLVRYFVPYLLPGIMTLGYILLQIGIEQRNYLLTQGGYSFGPQIILNPLRSLALIVAPLPNTEHADATWLVPLGTVVALISIGLLIYNCWRRCRPATTCLATYQNAAIVALALTLLPTAPFTSPPDSRYVYLPVMASALLCGFLLREMSLRYQPALYWRVGASTVLLAFIVAGTSAAGELYDREIRFAAASGPGGSLWQLASWACEISQPARLVVVDPPLATPHVEAISRLSCGSKVRRKIVSQDQLENAIKERTLVIGFAQGSAEVQRWP